MSQLPTPGTPTTLDNCDREPIHLPGSIQNHGTLIAVDRDGVVRYVGANVEPLLHCAVSVGETLEQSRGELCPAIAALLEDGVRALRGEQDVPMPGELQVGDRHFDVVLHLSGGMLVAEFELRHQSSGELAGFAVQAHRAMEKLRRPRAVRDLLQLATEELRALTGFDRVMAYRFRHDSSGEVVAESCIDTLDPYLGRRYPASDIPAQARRLYVANTLRLIADVRSTTVPLLQEAGALPLDLSGSILRSVSPIHIEYLSNMGVGASMSVSIVINEQLWGLLACHHMSPRQVPYSVRMACDVIAQVLSANIQSTSTRSHVERLQQATAARTRLVEEVLHADDEFAALCQHAAEMATALRSGGALVAHGAKLQVFGEVSEQAGSAIVRWLSAEPASQAQERLFHTQTLPLDAPALAGATSPWCGVLGIPFDRDRQGWLVFLRKEQIETIHWGGKPEKEVRPGPLGPRLTPRGSFDLWKETVRSTAEHWSTLELDVARQLLDELVRVQNARTAEINRTRNQLMAVLGHDLRDPLHSISMAARVLEQGGADGGRAGRIGQRIQSSSSRMQRLVSQVMDMSRLQSGLGLDLQRTEVDLVALLNDLMDEARTAHPGTEIVVTIPAALRAQVDADRIAQVVVNLISNARHHGQTGHPIQVHASATDEWHEIAVHNVAAPIADDIAGNLFSPFKASSGGNARNRSGMGLGLYIAHQIVLGHGGTITYEYRSPHVVFSVRFPLQSRAQ
ncbi:ATP-binding protein [Paracidovorax valerianellae]|uniref:histidine kinase n=1 Tax=Paracidovorax valerianellae TaxID=187868 RepID=A0A1G6JL87_9BURK|nr:ATP-binding protein [Paracidovorax valerianellae]MDA8445339.1 GAF domain-containing protein [Paracidovorax valerianellae]SDC18716.1 Bacteriophytochrome (light-regulated signal transduction histidine kinase) [Paracidovorax valerianellae]